MKNLFGGVYDGCNVFLTGHTGFKGSWLAYWLTRMGARVTGYALAPETDPNHLGLLNLEIDSIEGDIRDRESLSKAIAQTKPSIVFHMAAQPFVRRSYREPLETFETNVMGTANLLDACRKTDSIKTIVNITSDKCYENREWVWGYRETDPMGGYDPYSASKGCAELLTSSWRNSFFPVSEYGRAHHILLASVRAGNVIGGGDWGEDRLIPDIVRATVANEPVVIRSPRAVRPWQHVLEPLSGYLLLGQQLLDGKADCADSWNFGPESDAGITVQTVVESVKSFWDSFNYEITPAITDHHEAGLLRLDCSKARFRMGWHGIWNAEKTFDKTIGWYRNFYENGQINTEKDLEEYIDTARNQQLDWAGGRLIPCLETN